MTLDDLTPRLDLLSQKYVLIQAWKKTTNYIRYQNWYADTLGIDLSTVNLPDVISDIEYSLEHPDDWTSDPVRIVMAPKGQRWWVSPTTGVWEPRESEPRSSLRPLAHVSIRDQVVATAFMMCLANRVETRQGDPQQEVLRASAQRRVSSYGNRLFCETSGEGLSHRWGSVKLYRSYFHDYRNFVSRPSEVAESIDKASGERVFIIDADLSQFYDRVRPQLLSEKIRSFQRDSDDPKFFELADRLFDWQWDKRDEREALAYSDAVQVEDFSRIALPQGLVASGFFANVVLVSLDEALRDKIGQDIVPGIRVDDACRYVDDLRLVVTAGTSVTAEEVRIKVLAWIERELDRRAPGLKVAKQKTRLAEFGGLERPLVRQSIRMKRIQSAVSGGFDPLEGAEILDSIQGLMRSQDALNADRSESAWQFSPVPDVRDETVARFSAGRFRFAYRSIRPLLDQDPSLTISQSSNVSFEDDIVGTTPRSQSELDEDARAFALDLIERWVEDPSNVRVLRIGLDIWPDPDVLEGVLGLLRPYTQTHGPKGVPRRVAQYCLSEIFRSGATETGFVDEAECLPTSIDVRRFRETLRNEAARVIQLPGSTIPWYLRQQALLYHAVFDPQSAPIVRAGNGSETQHYRKLILFRRGQHANLQSADFATFATVIRRAFSRQAGADSAFLSRLTPTRRTQIAIRDPAFAYELAASDADFIGDLTPRMREDLCLDPPVLDGDLDSLAELVLKGHPENPLRNELSLLRFSEVLLQNLRFENQYQCITPLQVSVSLEEEDGLAEIHDIHLSPSQSDPGGSIYCPPEWCSSSDRWRFQLGYLLRFILTRQADFTRIVRPEDSKGIENEPYRPVSSHWYQRLYGLLNIQIGFGDDWLPISDWMEGFLLALMRWPGCRRAEEFAWVEMGIPRALEEIGKRVKYLNALRGSATGSLFLPMTARWPTANRRMRSLRACVAQTIVPDSVDGSDLEFAGKEIRRQHRRHLSTTIAAVRKMLELRRTHTRGDGRLDWLILPELSVHPDDVGKILIPFALKYRTIILAGLTYQELFHDEPLVNSALWVMPEWTSQYGLQIRSFRQGKAHLAPEEEQYNLRGFRPCQWLVGFPWSDDGNPLILTASICYDATDLQLASDLRYRSDIFAIPSLNRDVRTFDQMALALHYHMYQLVIVANNGRYGGSNAYWPLREQHEKQLFHLHGQPQASIAFLEVDNIADLLSRGQNETERVTCKKLRLWKSPPAGNKRALSE